MPSIKFRLILTYNSAADNNWTLKMTAKAASILCHKCEQLLTDRPWHKLTWSNASKAPGEPTTENLQEGCCDGHRGYRNKMVLAILNLHVALMPPTRFRLNLSYHSADEV